MKFKRNLIILREILFEGKYESKAHGFNIQSLKVLDVLRKKI